MDRRLRHPVLQLSQDVVAVHADLWPGDLPQRRIGDLREPPLDPITPVIRTHHRRPTRHDSFSLSRGQVLTDRFTVDTQTFGDLHLRPPGPPVLEQLHQIDHVERPPRHRGPLTAVSEGEPARCKDHTNPATLTVPMGNYVSAEGGELRDQNPVRPGELRDR